jgi:hypothetical protein
MKLCGCFLACILAATALAENLFGYPIDGYAETGIRRLERLRLIQQKEIRGTLPPPGGMRGGNEIKLNLSGLSAAEKDLLPVPDTVLQRKVNALFGRKNPNYSCAILDITPGRVPRFAAWKPEKAGVPGSVGKLAIAAGLFTELHRLFPNDIVKRKELLRTRMVRAGEWAMPNHHEVPVFDLKTHAYSARPVRVDDVFSLYEWTDHMLSASSNAAASVVWKEVILMRVFGAEYPPADTAETRYFSKTPKSEIGALANAVVNGPLRELDISEGEWNLGSFFTAGGKRLAPAGGGSKATPRALLRFLIRMEQGKIVDEWSSLEMKKFMYMTARRIRYASSPSLADAAVYFKSGSQYKCSKEAGFVCKKYHGNVENHMNSVVVVEHPDGTRYLVVLMSNVLKVNSAYDHQVIASEIDKMLREPLGNK